MNKSFFLSFFLISSIVSGQNLSEVNTVEFKSIHKIIQLVPIQDQQFSTGNTNGKLKIYYHNDSLILLKEYILTVKLIHNEEFSLQSKFDSERKFIVVKGSRVFFIYDVLADRLSNPCKPNLSMEDGLDAQSGQLSNLNLSEDGKILSLEARDFGGFSFDIEDLMSPKEFKREHTIQNR